MARCLLSSVPDEASHHQRFAEGYDEIPVFTGIIKACIYFLMVERARSNHNHPH
jgi:hypothetical protein